jgi:UDP-N-acetyl-L-fucosamine synthase
MKAMKVMTVVGTRPEIIRLSRVIAALDRHFEHVLAHTGQNHDYELNGIFFEDLDIRKPDVFLEAAGETACETVGRIIARMDAALRDIRPEALLILGDTNSCLAAYPAKRRKIPVFHMEAGNRCFDERVPEEINRRIVDHIADINMPYSAISREYLLREGIPPDRIIKTGSPMAEVIQFYKPKADRSAVLADLGLEAKGYYLVSAHREEDIEPAAQFGRFIRLLNVLAEEFGRPVVVSTHPRTRRRIDAEKPALAAGIRLCKPFCFSDYLRLQSGAIAVLSDSGTITEEASLLDLPAINIREAHERPEGMEEAAVMMTGMDEDTVRRALKILASQRRGEKRSLRIVADYDVPNVSDKVVRIILSYTDYVRRTVWRRGQNGEN